MAVRLSLAEDNEWDCVRTVAWVDWALSVVSGFCDVDGVLVTLALADLD
jgi:hypothetical protein